MKRTLDIPVGMKTRGKSPRVEMVDFDSLVSGSLSGASITRTEMFTYEGGSLRVYDYSTPATYQKYATQGWGGNQNTGKTDLYVRIGHDNRYPFFQLKLTAKSVTFQRAYDTAVNICAGDGFMIEGVEDDIISKALLQWLTDRGMGWDFNREMAMNILMFGGCYPMLRVEVKGGKVKLLGVETLNYHNMRAGKPDPKTGIIDRHWHSLRYNQTTARTDLRGYPAWVDLEEVRKNWADRFITDAGGRNWFAAQGEDGMLSMGKFTVLVGNPNIYSDFYPKAPWQSDVAINAALIEDALFAGYVADKENGMSAGYIVTVTRAENRKDAKQDQLDKDAIADKIRSLQGAENKGKVVVMYNTDLRSNNDAIKIAPIPHLNTSDMNGMVEEAKDQALLTAWGVVDGQLVGIPPKRSKGLSGQATALAEADDIWYVNFIHPSGVIPMEKFYNRDVLPFFTEETGIALPPTARIRIKRLKRFNYRPSDNILMYAYSKDEIRAKYGDAPLTEDARAELAANVQKPIPTTNG